MPRFYGLRLSLSGHQPSHAPTPSTTSRRSQPAAAETSASPVRVGGKPESLAPSRGVSARDRDMEDECLAEDFKRPRAEGPPLGQAPAGGLGRGGNNPMRNLTSEMLCTGSATYCESPSCSPRENESIYSLASPWLPSKEAASVKQLTPVYSSGAGRADSRTLCFDEGEEEEEQEQVGMADGERSPIFFSRLDGWQLLLSLLFFCRSVFPINISFWAKL